MKKKLRGLSMAAMLINVENQQVLYRQRTDIALFVQKGVRDNGTWRRSPWGKVIGNLQSLNSKGFGDCLKREECMASQLSMAAFASIG
ncbi:hypothetical protein D5086_010799 [Populus alba]|uniref:Uncharacterized protein n=1 Tax=Populus alba TaxID=43335 RepID=A0ACC4CB47_POPAL